jgi:bifunctional DNA-binding transcriptional regulator/antitoxin component of YhaV-PrlF toxin-antitoxin module
MPMPYNSADIRRDLGIAAGSRFDINITEGKIVLEKHTPTCIFCGEYATKKHADRDICEAVPGQ